ncbi:hypothetical protein A2U01_0029478, partial [Trifolium medium]|nr:hypothetical protein [Trifolium medium]
MCTYWAWNAKFSEWMENQFLYCFPGLKVLLVPLFPQELLEEEKKESEDKTNLINPEQSPPLNAVESNQRLPEDDHLVMQTEPDVANVSQEVRVFEEHDVGSGVKYEEEKKDEEEKLVNEDVIVETEEENKDEPVKEGENEEHTAENEDRPEGQDPMAELTTILPEQKTQVVDKGQDSGDIT